MLPELFSRPFRLLVQAWQALVEYLSILVEGLREALFEITLPVTQYALSKRPLAPSLTIEELGSNSLSLLIKQVPATKFNIDTFEVQKAKSSPSAEENECQWETCCHPEGTHPLIENLVPDTSYLFRVRAKNFWGKSDWSGLTRVQTLRVPVEGGSTGPNYSWQQTNTEVILFLPLNTGSIVRRNQVEICLKNRNICVTVRTADGPLSLVEGVLEHSVQPMGEGSFWELTRTGEGNFLEITLEKQTAAKDRLGGLNEGGLWSCAIRGHPRVDIRQIADCCQLR